MIRPDEWSELAWAALLMLVAVVLLFVLLGLIVIYTGGIGW